MITLLYSSIAVWAFIEIHKRRVHEEDRTVVCWMLAVLWPATASAYASVLLYQYYREYKQKETSKRRSRSNQHDETEDAQ